MKTIYGLLAVGACALAVGGCTTNEKTAFANALLSSGVANVDDAYQVATASDAATDKRTTASITTDEDLTPDNLETATLTVNVKNGGQAQGPTDYMYSDVNGGSPVLTPYAAFYRFDPTEPPPVGDTDNSILYAGAGMYSYAAVVGANDPDRGDSAAFNTAGFFAGIKPTNLPTIDDDVEYQGTAAAAVGSEIGSEHAAGASTLYANFGTGRVMGEIGLTGSVSDNTNTIAFTGDMSTNHATYSAASGVAGQSLTLNDSSAFGQVVGGFFGPNGVETAGAFDVQDHAGAIGADADPSSVKITGAFGGTSDLH